MKFGTHASAYTYVQLNWNITPRLSIAPGVRIDRYALTGEDLVSPRFGARFSLTSKVAVTFAAGIYRQPPSLFTMSLRPGNRALKAQTATHFIGGIEWLAREDTRVRLEVFRKNYENLAVSPLRPTVNFPRDGNYYNSGSGFADGFEISVQKALTGFLTGQASYGYTRSRRRFFPAGIEFPSDLERPHQLTLVGITRFRGFSVAAKYRLASGLPYSARTPVEVFPNSFYLHPADRLRTGHQPSPASGFREPRRARRKTFRLQKVVVLALHRHLQRDESRHHRAAQLRVPPAGSAVPPGKQAPADLRPPAGVLEAEVTG